MKIGIIGTPQVGKTTIFQMLTNITTQGGQKANQGIARVPDSRIDVLSSIYKPKKTTYATIELVDIAGLTPGTGNTREFLNSLRDVDVLVQVVRAFASDSVPRADEALTPMADLTCIQEELVVTDWSFLENRLERLERQRAKNPGLQKEIAVLEKCKVVLERGLPLRNVELDEEEEAILRGYEFFTDKPVIIVVNLDEEQMTRSTYPDQEKLQAWCRERDIPLVLMSAQVEMEISQLEPEDGELFMQELGLKEKGLHRLAQAAYAHLGRISFFTVGDDEVKAWTITKGSSARSAAGKIHSDIERGFIRAEVVKYPDFVEHGGMVKLKEKGLFRLEGKEYEVKDGDMINFRFNV